jgi:hypothetical protein
LSSEPKQTTATAGSPPDLSKERALEWMDEALVEFEHALQACGEAGVDEALVSAKINGLVMRLMTTLTPDLGARAAQAPATGETVSKGDAAA